MKHLFLSISIICSINCFAQEPNSDLFQTWYLYSVFASDASQKTYVVSEIEPTITPSLTIMENLVFNGIGACNTFNGTFNLLNSNMLETDQYSNSTNDCGIQTHNLFENEYFNFMQLAGVYSISSENNGMVLTIDTAIFGQAIFKNIKLSTSDFPMSQIEIYPNPSNSIIYIKSQNIPITKIEIYNSLGQNLKTIINKFKTIEVSYLSNGIYIMKIFTELGIINEKIIKN